MAFLQELQSAPHETKVRWLVALSIIAFAAVIWIWASAVPTMVAINPPATAENPDPKPEFSGVASIVDIFTGR